MKSLFEDKEIVNPMDPEEVFTCSDLTEDYKICRKEKRMQTSVVGKRMNCTEFRTLGKYQLQVMMRSLVSDVAHDEAKGRELASSARWLASPP